MNACIRPLLSIVLICALTTGRCHAAEALRFDDDRVMLQGFYWESHRHGHPDRYPTFGEKRWYDIVREQAAVIQGARFDLVWLPPPCYAGDDSAGYNPKQYFRLDNSYGSADQHRAVLVELLGRGLEPVADVVLNHRDGDQGWADFKAPALGLWAVAGDDEAFRAGSPSGLANTPADQRGKPEERPTEYAGHGGTTYQYKDFRDLDHTDVRVRRDAARYLLLLKSAGYRGWRFDMVHGYHARWVHVYNRLSEPSFSVGEYDWGAHAEMRGWMWHAATRYDLPGADRLRTSSGVFDFTTYFALKANKGRYTAWYGFRNGLGMVGDTTDGMPWKQRAVTFVENHDTGYRTERDGRPEQGHESDSFANGWEVEQAYAQVLTHPGVPCVYWKHYFDWGPELRNKIRALVNARKVAGVHSGSKLNLQDNARAAGVYGAMVEGSDAAHQLYVRIGGDDGDWEPGKSGYAGFREYAQGDHWKVWVKHPKNPEFQQAPSHDKFDVPALKDTSELAIPDNDLAP